MSGAQSFGATKDIKDDKDLKDINI